MKNILFGLLTVTAIGAFIAPAIADEVMMQNSQQITTQEGNSNRSSQHNSQTIRSSTRNHRTQEIPPSYGGVQDAVQDSYQLGEKNTIQQYNRQEINRNTRPVR
jgi:hypothetical protein